MDRKNLGQKIVVERFFDSISLIIQRLKYSFLIALLSYCLSFHLFFNIRNIFIPIQYFYYSFIYNHHVKLFDKFLPHEFVKIRFYFFKKIFGWMVQKEIYSISIFCVVFILSYILMTRFFSKKGDLLNQGRHYRGLRIVTKKEFDNEIEMEIKSCETGLKYSENDIFIGSEKIRIPRQLGANMWAYLGNSGTGKSQAIFSHLIQIRKHQEKCIIVDPGGEYYKIFGEKNDIILSLYDVRSEFYSFWEEGLNPLRIAKSLIEENSCSQDFWSKAGQALFAALITLNSNAQDMYQMLFLEYEELKVKLRNAGLAAGIVLGEAEQAGSVLATAAVDLVWLKDLNYWAQKCGKTNPFSISKWVKNDEDKRWVFLTSDDKNWSTSKHLIRLWTDIAVLSSFERKTHVKTVPLWLVCDELSSIGKLPSMSILEDRGRKYGMGLITGFQTPSQLEVIYGKPLARVIIQGLQNMVFFRSNEQEMLEFMSQMCGDAEYIQTTASQSFSNKNTESVSDQIIRKRNILPDEFKALKNMNAFLKISSHNPVRIKIDYLEFPIKNEPNASYVPHFDVWDGWIKDKKFIQDESEKPLEISVNNEMNEHKIETQVKEKNVPHDFDQLNF